MPAPSVQFGNLRPDLSEYLEFDLLGNIQGFVGYQIMPLFDVQLQTSPFTKMAKEELAKLADVVRTSNGSYNRITTNFAKDSYATEEYGLEIKVDERNKNIYKNVINSEMAATMLCYHNVLAKAEIRVCDKVFDTTTYTPTTVTNEWDDHANATPIDDVMAAAQRVRNKTGQYANAVIFNREVRRNVVRCQQIIDRIAGQGAGSEIEPASITNGQLAQCFDVKQVIVPDCSFDATDEGQSNTNLTDIWSKEYCAVGKIAETSLLEEVAFGRTFHYTGDGSQRDGLVEYYYSDELRGDVVRVRHETDEKVMHEECMELLDNISS